MNIKGNKIREHTYEKLLGTLFAATLVLSACSQDDTKEDENKKSESTTEKKADDKKIRTLKRTKSLKKKRNLKKTKITSLHKKIILLTIKTHRKLQQ